MSQQSDGQTVMVQGRIVWTSGDLFSGQMKTEFNSNKPKLNDQGEQMKEYGFGLAVPKEVMAVVDPGSPGHIWGAIHEERAKLYPANVPPAFAMKYKDGDAVDHNGQPFSLREGYAGHIVFSLSTTIPIKYFKWENNQNIQVNEGIKCGDYVKVQVQIKAHGPIGQGKAGLYLNPMAVQFIGYGKEIINAPSGDQIFGLSQPDMPAGATAAPVGPNPGAQIIPAATPMVNTAAAQPYHNVLPPQQPMAAPAPQYQAPAPAMAPPMAAPAPQAYRPAPMAAPMPAPAMAAPAPQPMAVPGMPPVPGY